MRNIKISPGEYYHIFNRGVNKQLIFGEDRDRVRFLFLILYFQSKLVFSNIVRCVKYYVQHRVFNIDTEVIKEVVQNREIELVAFCLMPNHFHLILKELEPGGIGRYMQRVLNSYTKYFNTKYKKSGHLMSGPYKAVHVKDNRQLLHLSAYIHRNPRELKEWLNKERKYVWSSYMDMVGECRWGDLLAHKIVTGQFDQKITYENFVKTSPAKRLKEEFDMT